MEQRKDIISFLTARNYKPKKVGRNYRITPCPACDSKTGLNINPDRNLYNCFSCGISGSLYKWLVEVEKMSEKEAYKELQRVTNAEDITKKAPLEPVKAPTTPQHNKDYIQSCINKLHQKNKNSNINELKGIQYLINRGISLDTINKYKITYGDIKNNNGKKYHNVLIFPLSENNRIVSFSSRTIGQDNRYYNNTGTMYMFNGDYLKESNQILFLTEGIIDALSIEEMGYKAIALNGVGRVKALIEEIKKQGKNNHYVSAMDNDKAGKNATTELKKALGKDMQILSYSDKIKDPNEYIIKDKEGFKRALESAKKNIINLGMEKLKPTLETYILNQYAKDLEDYRRGSEVKTGYKELDEKLNGLHNNLYVIGGMSGTGKTTLASQIMDNLAIADEHVIYLSLEQSIYDIATKSLIRQLKKDYENITITAQQLKMMNFQTKEMYQKVKDAIKKYSRIAKNITIIEGDFHFDVFTLSEYIKEYISITGIKPVVIVDYLQILPAPKGNLISDKQKVDINVTQLKRITRVLKVPLICISSLGRDNYLNPINYNSFKETGGIEYTADVLMGLQYAVTESEEMEQISPTKRSEKWELVNDAKREYPVELTLKILKNRNGESGDINFKFYWESEYMESEPTLKRASDAW